MVVLLCAGGMVGTDSLSPLGGGRLVMAVDLRKEYLDAFGETKAVLWQKTQRQRIVDAVAAKQVPAAEGGNGGAVGTPTFFIGSLHHRSGKACSPRTTTNRRAYHG